MVLTMLPMIVFGVKTLCTILSREISLSPKLLSSKILISSAKNLAKLIGKAMIAKNIPSFKKYIISLTRIECQN